MKKLFTRLILPLMMVGIIAGSLSGCNKYDDDIDELRTNVDNVSKVDYTFLSNQLDALQYYSDFLTGLTAEEFPNKAQFTADLRAALGNKTLAAVMAELVAERDSYSGNIAGNASGIAKLSSKTTKTMSTVFMALGNAFPEFPDFSEAEGLEAKFDAFYAKLDEANLGYIGVMQKNMNDVFANLYSVNKTIDQMAIDLYENGYDGEQIDGMLGTFTVPAEGETPEQPATGLRGEIESHIAESVEDVKAWCNGEFLEGAEFIAAVEELYLAPQFKHVLDSLVAEAYLTEGFAEAVNALVDGKLETILPLIDKVSALESRISKLEGKVQSITWIPENDDEKLPLVGKRNFSGEYVESLEPLTMSFYVSPASAALEIKAAFEDLDYRGDFKILFDELKKSYTRTITEDVANFPIKTIAVNGNILTVTTDQAQFPSIEGRRKLMDDLGSVTATHEFRVAFKYVTRGADPAVKKFNDDSHTDFIYLRKQYGDAANNGDAPQLPEEFFMQMPSNQVYNYSGTASTVTLPQTFTDPTAMLDQAWDDNNSLALQTWEYNLIPSANAYSGFAELDLMAGTWDLATYLQRTYDLDPALMSQEMVAHVSQYDGSAWTDVSTFIEFTDPASFSTGGTMVGDIDLSKCKGWIEINIKYGATTIQTVYLPVRFIGPVPAVWDLAIIPQPDLDFSSTGVNYTGLSGLNGDWNNGTLSSIANTAVGNLNFVNVIYFDDGLAEQPIEQWLTGNGFNGTSSAYMEFVEIERSENGIDWAEYANPAAGEGIEGNPRFTLNSGTGLITMEGDFNDAESTYSYRAACSLVIKYVPTGGATPSVISSEVTISAYLYDYSL